MIEAGLEFPHSARRLVMEAFLSLPEDLRPVRESVNEDDVGKEIKDHQRLVETVSKRQTGLFLKGSHVTYDISIAGTEPLMCSCFLEVEPALVKHFMIHMASARPIFGFACAPEEREWRNRITAKQGVNSIESWVGRHAQRYIPGLYWLTLLPTALAEKHGVSLPAVEGAALEHIEIEGGQHLFRFYEEPKDWRSAVGVGQLCSSLPGIFDVQKVREQAALARNFLEFNEVVRNWK